MDRRKLFLAVAALVVVILAAVGLATNRDRGITRNPDKVDLADAGEEQARSPDERRLQALCASSATYARLKEVAFEEAFRIRNADPTNLDRLAASSVVRMEDPVVKSYDEGSDIVVCGGRFVLELPPGAERAFNGERRLVADIEYSAQAAADGSGMVYQLNGADSIIYRLASFDMPTAPPQPAPIDGEVELAEVMPPPAVGGPEEGEEEADEPRAAPTPRSTGEPTPRPSPRATSRPSPTPSPRATTAARDRDEPPARPRAVSNPSFNCRYARTRSEVMVCGSARLAAKDRAMSSLFYSALADADPRQRRELRRTRDRFLAYRDRCRDEACVAEAYDGRMDEIRDIMANLE
jgi:hypothetical protein